MFSRAPGALTPDPLNLKIKHFLADKSLKKLLLTIAIKTQLIGHDKRLNNHFYGNGACIQQSSSGCQSFVEDHCLGVILVMTGCDDTLVSLSVFNAYNPYLLRLSPVDA